MQVVSAFGIAICGGNLLLQLQQITILPNFQQEKVLNPSGVKNVNCCSMDTKMQLIWSSVEPCTACVMLVHPQFSQ